MLRSTTTRQDGVVASIDLAPTILRRLGLPVPAQIKGEPATAVPGSGAADLVDLYDRLRVVSGRRLPALEALLAAWVAALLLLGAIAGRAGLRRGGRWGGLGGAVAAQRAAADRGARAGRARSRWSSWPAAACSSPH